ncbi:RNA polymerase sigma factor [bacterium]|nr:RNA polymerase sigma factor [bacterium]
MPTDHETMLAVREGDIEKLGSLFEEHHKRLYNFFLRQTGNTQASEDLVQDVFLRMLKYRHTYLDNGNFDTWMFSIARNARVDYYRENTVRHVQLEEAEHCADTMPNPEEKFSHDHDVDMVRKALAELDEDKREVILLSRFGNLRYEEIGKILGCTVGAVKVRVFRAVKELSTIYFRLAGDTTHEM